MAVVYPMMTNADCRRCYKPHQLVDSHLAPHGDGEERGRELKSERRIVGGAMVRE